MADHNHRLYNWYEIGRYQLVIQFEIHVKNEIPGAMNKKYNDEAYEKAHSLDRLNIRR